MNTLEIFPPNEEELEQMIKELEELEDKMDNAESKAEWNDYKKQQEKLKDKIKQLITLNNAL